LPLIVPFSHVQPTDWVRVPSHPAGRIFLSQTRLTPLVKPRSLRSGEPDRSIRAA
jgi:hypothetical protein